MAVQPGKGAMVGGFLSAWWNEWNPVWRKHSEDRSFHLMNSQLFLSKLKQFWIQDLYSDDVERRASNAIAFNHWAKTFNSTRGTSSNWDFGDHITATKRSRYLADRISTSEGGNNNISSSWVNFTFPKARISRYLLWELVMLSFTTREPHRERSGSLQKLEIWSREEMEKFTEHEC